MQRSGQTAKTQSSAKAPGRGALSPAPRWEERSALPRGQPGGSGSRSARAAGHCLRPGARTAGGTAAPGVTQRSPATLRGTSESSSGTDVRAASPTQLRLRQQPAAGGTPGRAGGGAAQSTGAAGQRGLRSAATRARKLRRRPSRASRRLWGERGGKWFSRGGFPTCDTSGTSVCSTERVRISSPASAPSPDEDDEETPLLLHGDVAIAGEPSGAGTPSSRAGRRCAPARAARARRSPHAAPPPGRRPRPAPAGAPLPRRAMPRARAESPPSFSLSGPFPAPRDGTDLKRQLPPARLPPRRAASAGGYRLPFPATPFPPPPAPLRSRRGKGTGNGPATTAPTPSFPSGLAWGGGRRRVPARRGEAGAGGG